MKARRWAPSKPDMTTPKTLPERLLDTAENIHSRGAGIAEKMLREAAEAITQHRGQLEAYREHFHELGQHLVEAHKPGEVDPEAVAILDGYHVGTREVAGGGAGEPGEDTVAAALRLLKLALARGAFRLPQFTDLTPRAGGGGRPVPAPRLAVAVEPLPLPVDQHSRHRYRGHRRAGGRCASGRARRRRRACPPSVSLAVPQTLTCKRAHVAPLASNLDATQRPDLAPP